MMPVDMALRIFVASSPPLRSFLSNHDNHCSSSSLLRSCLSPASCGGVPAAMAPRSLEAGGGGGGGGGVWLRRKRRRKKVVFADAHGFALTSVHVFSEAEERAEEEAQSELQFQLSLIEGATARLHLGEDPDAAARGSVLVLDFVPPGLDYLELRRRLQVQQVCLETCSVQGRVLSGTVQVQNRCFQKSVWVRITFNAWSSFQDVACHFLHNLYGRPDTDTFSFCLSIPDLSPPAAVEFCLRYQAQDQNFWDNNGGNNYRLLLDPQGENLPEPEIDPYGSPRTSAGIFPEWQSWGCTEPSTPYW